MSTTQIHLATPVHDAVVLTGSDQAAIQNIVRRAQMVLYIQYTKGSEASLAIGLDFSFPTDPLFTPFFAAESLFDATTGAVAPKQYVISTTGNFRIPIPLLVLEDRVQVRIRANTPGGGPGTVSAWVLPAIPNTAGAFALIP